LRVRSADACSSQRDDRRGCAAAAGDGGAKRAARGGMVFAARRAAATSAPALSPHSRPSTPPSPQRRCCTVRARCRWRAVGARLHCGPARGGCLELGEVGACYHAELRCCWTRCTPPSWWAQPRAHTSAAPSASARLRAQRACAASCSRSWSPARLACARCSLHGRGARGERHQHAPHIGAFQRCGGDLPGGEVVVGRVMSHSSTTRLRTVPGAQLFARCDVSGFCRRTASVASVACPSSHCRFAISPGASFRPLAFLPPLRHCQQQL